MVRAIYPVVVVVVVGYGVDLIVSEKQCRAMQPDHPNAMLSSDAEQKKTDWKTNESSCYD